MEARHEGPTPLNISCAHDAAAMLTHVRFDLAQAACRASHTLRPARLDSRVLDRHRRVVSFCAAAASSPSSVGRSTTSARSSRASTSCARSPPGEALSDAAASCDRAATVLLRMDGWTKGRSACCRRSTRSRRWASIRPTLRQITGSTSTTACPSMRSRAPTRARAIKPGSSGGEIAVMTRSITIVATSIASAALGTSAAIDLPKPLLWNASASAPHRPLRRAACRGPPGIGLSSSSCRRLMLATFLAARGYLPKGSAAPETRSCAHGADSSAAMVRRFSPTARPSATRPHP